MIECIGGRGQLLTESPWGKIASLARAGQDGARATRGYYASAGADERRLVRASFFTGITGGILWYVLFLYWASLGFTSEQIGLMGATGSGVGVLAYLIGGYLADRLGRRTLFLVGLFFTAAGLIMFLTERNIYAFTIAYSLTSMGGSLAWPSLMALMAEKTTPANMKYFYGIQGFYNQIGLTIATFFGIFGPSFLHGNFNTNLSGGYTLVFLITALCAIPPIVYVLKVSEKRKTSGPLLAHYDRRMRRILLMYCLQNGMIGVGAAFVIPWFPLIFEQGMGATGEQIALIITLSNAVIAAGWFIVPKFADLRGSVALITVCQIASVVPLILIPYSSSLLIVVAMLYAARSFLMLVPSPVLNAYTMNIVSEEIRASFLAIGQIAWQLPFSISLAVAGYLWANDYSRTTPFYVATVLYATASVVFYVYFRNVKESHFEIIDKG
jgi:MFS family permease